jgi:hypothetical protein
MTTSRDRGIVRVLARRSRRASPTGLAGPGVTRRYLRGLLVVAGPYPGLWPACTVTPHREERCLTMSRYAPPGYP